MFFSCAFDDARFDHHRHLPHCDLLGDDGDDLRLLIRLLRRSLGSPSLSKPEETLNLIRYSHNIKLRF